MLSILKLSTRHRSSILAEWGKVPILGRGRSSRYLSVERNWIRSRRACCADPSQSFVTVGRWSAFNGCAIKGWICVYRAADGGLSECFFPEDRRNKAANDYFISLVLKGNAFYFLLAPISTSFICYILLLIYYVSSCAKWRMKLNGIIQTRLY